jgi:hypothetical protein
LKNNNSTLIIVVTLLLILGGLIFYFSDAEIDWSENYRYDSKSPYGTHIIKSLLENNSNNAEFIFIKDSTYKELNTSFDKVNNYVFVGDMFFTSQRDIDSLANFVANGNKAYIVASNIDNRFFAHILQNMPADSVYDTVGVLDDFFFPSEEEITESEEVYIEEDDPYSTYDGEQAYENQEVPAYEDYEEEAFDTTQYLTGLSYIDIITSEAIFTKFKNKTYSDDEQNSTYWNEELIPLEKEKYIHEYIYEFKPQYHDWHFFNSLLFENIPNEKIEIISLGRADDGNVRFFYPNYIKIKYGKGHFYLHLNPLALSNYQLMQERQMEYARRVFDELGDGKIYWSEDNRYYDYSQFQSQSNTGLAEEGPMEFILSEPSLRKGWYLLIVALLLYFLFGAKRKQRPIPVIAKKENTSIEYAEVIAQLFLSQTDHKQLIQLKSEQFKFYLRDRFNIHLAKTLNWQDEAAMKLIASKTNTKTELITSIIKEEGYLRNLNTVDTPTMLSYHHKLEEFYKSSK